MRKNTHILALAFLTFAALVVHGYHPYAEDAEIYLPGVEKILHPDLFPTGTEFFESHAGLTLFPHLIAASVRLTHVPFDYVLFCWHIGSIFLLLLAAWELSGHCFNSGAARWGAVGLMASLLTLPVAGTALYVMDQYLNPRNITGFAELFAVARTLERRYLRAALWLLFGAACHPLMGAFGLSFCLLFVVLEYYRQKYRPGVFAVLPLRDFFGPSSPAYHEAAQIHGFHYLANWAWYEQVGILAPVAIFAWLGRIARGRNLATLARMCRALIIYDLVYFVAALVISLPKRFELLARVQPLRSLHLLYMLLIVIGGAFIGEYILKKGLWRWIALFLPLCGGMFFAQRALFPCSAHIEWPWVAPKNPWEQAFLWIRQTTPRDAIFIIEPGFLKLPGEDSIGFRATAERSRLADAYKDSGAVSMFPPLAEEWWKQIQAQKNSTIMTRTDFLQLQREYGVTWAVLQAPDTRGLSCPYSNPAVLVCRIEP